MSSVRLSVDSSDVDAALDSILSDIEQTENMVDDVEAERERVERRVDDTVRDSNQALRRSLAFSRRVAATVRAVLSGSASAADQIFASIAEAVLITAEALIDVATAESLTVVGAFSAGIKIAFAFKLLQKSRAIQQKRVEEVSAIERQISIISPWTY